MGQEMELDRDVTVYLRKARSDAPDSLKEFFTRFEELYDRKYVLDASAPDLPPPLTVHFILINSIQFRLWHQLTVQLEKFVEVPEAARYLVPLYENFIVDFEKKMNQLSCVQYMVRASREFEGT